MLAKQLMEGNYRRCSNCVVVGGAEEMAKTKCVTVTFIRCLMVYQDTHMRKTQARRGDISHFGFSNNSGLDEEETEKLLTFEYRPVCQVLWQSYLPTCS